MFTTSFSNFFGIPEILNSWKSPVIINALYHVTAMDAKSKTIHIGAATLSKLISGTVAAITVCFVAAFIYVIGGFFPEIKSADGFFGSANVLFYLTIEGLFLGLVVYASYMSLRTKAIKS